MQFYIMYEFSDFGVDELVDFATESNFPWLMSNVYDKMTKRPLADGETFVILQWNGHKVIYPNMPHVIFACTALPVISFFISPSFCLTQNFPQIE